MHIRWVGTRIKMGKGRLGDNLLDGGGVKLCHTYLVNMSNILNPPCKFSMVLAVSIVEYGMNTQKEI